MSQHNKPDDFIEVQIERSRLELLDMGLRGNPQLNCRSGSQKVLDIVDEKSSLIYELMVNKEVKMSFLPIPKVYQKKKEIEDQSDTLTFEKTESIQLPPLDVYLEEKSGDARFSDKCLQTGLIPEKLDKSLLRIETEAHNLLQEQGIEVLYLALGFLKWYEDDRTQSARYAPLILVPVELIRSSARDGFKLKHTGEDIGPNLTLAAKLSGEYDLKLPTYHDEFEPDEYYRQISEAVAKQTRWQVMEDRISLSLFSFGKFQMYMDLDPKSWPQGRLPSQCPLLCRLLKNGFEDSEVLVKEASKHDFLQSPEKLSLVKDADSSQLESIIAVQNGADLIIQGPPGTGKSQTITNIIADSLGRGKKILFVAQKLAALEVVKKRLDESHLGDAVLELHSHKSTKKSVLASLAQAMDQGKPNIPDRSQEYAQLAECKTSLTEYVDAIQKPILSSNVNYVDALGLLQQTEILINDEKLPKLTFTQMQSWTPELFFNAMSSMERLVEHLDNMGVPADSSFSMTDRSELTPVDQKYIAEMSKTCSDILEELVEQNNDLALSMGINLPQNLIDVKLVNKAASHVLEVPQLSGIKVNSLDWLTNPESIKEGLFAGLETTRLYEQYEQIFIEQAFEENLLIIRSGLIGRTDKWWRVFSGQYRNAKKTLAGLCKVPLPTSPNEWLIWIDDLLEFQKQRKRLNGNKQLLTRLFGTQYRGTKTDWQSLSDVASWITELHMNISNGQLPKGIAEYLENNVDRQQHRELFESSEKLASLLEKDMGGLFSRVSISKDSDFSGDRNASFSGLKTLFNNWQDVDGLYQYARFNELVTDLDNIGLSDVAKLSKNWSRDNRLLTTMVKHCYYNGLVVTAYDQSNAIKKFDRASHEKQIDTFRKLDEGSLAFAQEKLAEYIFESLPRRQAKGEMEILMRELGKKSRHLPIRQLLVKAGNAVQQIKPIFMMSPMSISTYLKQGSVDFDLVIFDEASQIQAPDALGALMRGKQVVVVGDSKQMPPADLFGKSVQLADEDVEDSTTAEMESILSLMEAKGVPQIMLRWHYRSRHDSLIAVSNNQFYEGKLLAFPSSGAQKEAKGLSFNYSPENIYGEGGTASNLGEAQSIAEAVLRHAKNFPQLSLGVVAFGIVQRETIILEVEKLRRENPECETFFQHNEGGDEFFIKNLENVQGDERDVIYISVCYGRKNDGKIYQNFGLINKVGGERRLNVLISRARLSMEVFANFKAEDMRVQDNSPFGVKALKVFLQFAEKGRFEGSNHSDLTEMNPFASQLFRAVKSLGYSVDRHIGSQGFKLDMGVKNPENEEQYLLAIESDGSMYQDATSVRDRERLRSSVLGGLGWRQHRVWSTNWYRNKDAEIARIEDLIQRAFENQKLIEAQSQNDNFDPNIVIPVNSATAKTPDVDIERVEQNSEEPKSFVPAYKMVGNSELGLPRVDDFGGIPTATLTNAVTVLVGVEGPIIPSLIITRLASAAGLARAGARIKRQVEAAIDNAVNNRQINSLNGALISTESPSIVLRSWEHLPDSYRKLDNVCDDEIVNALLLTVQDAYTVEVKDAIAGAFSLLGFKRVTAQGSSRATKLIEQQLKLGLVIIENGRLKITQSEKE